jgi:hypothetical protein
MKPNPLVVWKNFTVPVVIRRCPIHELPAQAARFGGAPVHKDSEEALRDARGGGFSRSAVVEYATVTIYHMRMRRAECQLFSQAEGESRFPKMASASGAEWNRTGAKKAVPVE